MSTNLYWEPAERPLKAVGDTALKSILRERFGFPVKLVLSASNISYLSGLQDAGVDGAKELIAAIEKHGSITLTERE